MCSWKRAVISTRSPRRKILLDLVVVLVLENIRKTEDEDEDEEEMLGPVSNGS